MTHRTYSQTFIDALCVAGAVLSTVPLLAAQEQPTAIYQERTESPAEHKEDYWTPERMRKAKPLPQPTVKTPSCPAEEPSSSEQIPPVGAEGQSPQEDR
jgi:hypothetical protein